MLLTFALKEEEGGLFNDYRYIITGIGKVNAAHALTKAIYENRPKLVVNLGTAGSFNHKIGDIINPIYFKDDMDLSSLGFINRQEKGLSLYHDQITLICKTVTNINHDKKYECVDMEAFALATVCHNENIPFACLKYVSDNANENAVNDWKKSLQLAPKALYATLQNLIEHGALKQHGNQKSATS